MLAQHFHHPTVGCEILIDPLDLGHPNLAGNLVHRVQSVGRGLVRTEQPEVLRLQIQLHHVAQIAAEHARRLSPDRARSRYGHGISAEAG